MLVVFPAYWPRNAFWLPKLCRNRVPPIVMLPTAAPVLGSARFPARVTVPAEKLPEPSLRTTALAVLAETALKTTVAPWVPVTSPARLPEKLVAVVAEVAVPLRFPVIVPAEKFPEPSRDTIAPRVFVGVAFEVTVTVPLPAETLKPLLPLRVTLSVCPLRLLTTWPGAKSLKYPTTSTTRSAPEASARTAMSLPSRSWRTGTMIPLARLRPGTAA